jgi:hypothetical protein
MPIYLEISRFHRTASIVARGYITTTEVMSLLKQLFEAQIQPFAKLVDFSASTSDLKPEQITGLAQRLSGDPRIPHGPVAFLVNAEREGFAHLYAQASEGKRAVRLFTNLHAARKWLSDVSAAAPQGLVADQVAALEARASREMPPPHAPWTDPERQGTVFRGERLRRVQVR